MFYLNELRTYTAMEILIDTIKYINLCHEYIDVLKYLRFNRLFAFFI